MSSIFRPTGSSHILRNAEEVRQHLLNKVNDGQKGLVGTELELFLTEKNGLPLSFARIEALMERLAARFEGTEKRKEKGRIIGLHLPDVGDICLEPGGQIELSTKPCRDLVELRNTNEIMRHALTATAAAMDVTVTGQGHMSAFLQAPDMPRSRFAAYYAYCRNQHGAPAEDLIGTMKSVSGLQINVDPMGDDFHEIYRALMIVELAQSFSDVSVRQKRLQETYANLFPLQVTPLFNALSSRNNEDVMDKIVTRLLQLKVPFVPDLSSAEGFKSTLEIFGHAPSLNELMQKGMLSVEILDNSLSLQMTMPNLRRHGVVETRAPDSVNTTEELMQKATLYHRYAYDPQARRDLLQRFSGLDEKLLERAYLSRFSFKAEALDRLDLGGGLTVADLKSVVTAVKQPAPVAKKAPGI